MDSESKLSQVRIAVHGFGLFAAPCKKFLTADDIKVMFTEMTKKTEQVILSESELMEDRIQILPSFLESLASIIYQLDDLTDPFLKSIEKLVAMLIVNFPLLSKPFQPHAPKAVVLVLIALIDRNCSFQPLVSRIVYDGLTRTCSHMYVNEADAAEGFNQADFDVNSISYRHYLPFWHYILDSKTNATMYDNASSDARQFIATNIYNQLQSSTLDIINKLDLRCIDADITEKQEPSHSENEEYNEVDLRVDPLCGLSPAMPMDFQIFINLVDFTREISLQKHTYLFRQWLRPFTYQLTVFSTRHPLVSGFYKMLTSCSKICVKEDYVQEISSGLPDSTDVTDTYHLLLKFSKEVISRMHLYKDDLLVACSEFILSLPPIIIIKEVSDIVPVLKRVLKLGLGYPRLASIGLRAIELWQKTVPVRLIKPYYAEILPCLDFYLKFSSFDNSKTKENDKMNKLSKFKYKGSMKNSTMNFEHSKFKIKMRIIQILGKLGSELNSLLVRANDEDSMEAAVAWDDINHLPFQVPFTDMKPIVYLDQFLPRIVELACTSSDRQIKIAACELLHAIIIFTIGIDGQKSSSRNIVRPSTAKLYEKIFPILLTLACDVDQVTRQLFEPLMFQVIHWFTSKSKGKTTEVGHLLTAILDGIGHPTDAALRDFSAKCIQEYLEWSVRQSKTKDKKIDQINILIRGLHNLCLHPNPHKRLSAAIAFNSIYRIFREQEQLVDVHIFDLLVSFVDGLALAHGDNKSIGTQESYKQCLNHIERIIRTKAPLLQKKNEDRHKPRQFEEATLDHCILWLVKQCGRPYSDCRHKCMELICKLSPQLTGISNAKGYFEKLLKIHDVKYLIDMFEGSEGEENGIGAFLLPSNMADHFSLPICLRWFDIFLVALDCFIWIVDQKLFDITSYMKGSHLWKSMQFFIENVACYGLAKARENFEQTDSKAIFTPQEINSYNYAKCTVIVRLMDFISMALTLGSSKIKVLFPKSFWNDHLWNMILYTVFTPISVGFDFNDPEVAEPFPSQINSFLTSLRRDLNQENLKLFSVYMNTYLMNEVPIKKYLKVPLHDANYLCNIFFGHTQIYKNNFLDKKTSTQHSNIAGDLLEAIISKLWCFQNGVQHQASLSPTHVKILKEMFALWHQLKMVAGESQVSELVRVLIDNTKLKSDGCSGQASLNQVMISVLGDEIANFVIDFSSAIVDEFLNHLSSDVCILNIISDIAEIIAKHKDMRKRVNLTKDVFKHWEQIEKWGGESEERHEVIFNLVTKLLIIDSKFLKNNDDPWRQSIFKMYCKLLEARTSPASKDKVLALLPFFCDVPEQDLVQLNESLKVMAHRHFVAIPPSINLNHPEVLQFKLLFSKLLAALELCSSTMLLDFVSRLICAEENHICGSEFMSSISRFMHRVPRLKQVEMVEVAYSIFVSESRDVSDIMRNQIINIVCIPLLENSSTNNFTQFYEKHIKDIVEFLQESKVQNRNTELALKTGACKLIEILYMRLPVTSISSINSGINQAYCGQVKTGKELTTAVSKLLHDAKKRRFKETDASLQELRRQFQCSAYNAFMAIIMKTQSDIKFYKVFLFSENKPKGDFLWNNIINKDRTYTFNVEFDTPLARKKKFSTIKSQISEGRQRMGNMASSVHYITSQYLSESSLNEATAPYDFSSSDEAGRMNRSEPLEDYNAVLEYVELEMDELNSHECMASLSTVLNHMKNIGIIETLQEGVEPDEMPQWMNEIYKTFTDEATPANVKLFFAKLIINNQEIFKPYAMFWIQPLVHLLIGGNIGTSINYFTSDIIATLLSWSSVAIPQDTASGHELATELTKFIINNCYQPKRPIMTNNLDLVKMLIECWKPIIKIPFRAIYENMRSTSTSSKENSVGIQLLGIVLVNDIPVYENLNDVSFQDLTQRLLRNMNYKYKEIYGAATEVVGLLLKQLSSTSDSSNLDSLAQNTDHLILNIMNANRDWDKALVAIHNINKHYQKFTERYIQKLLFQLPKLRGLYRSICLELAHSCIDLLPDAFLQLKNQDVLSLLKHNDGSVQYWTLRIVQKILDSLDSDQLLYVMPSIVSFSKSNQVNCRKIMADIVMATYEKYSERIGEDESSKNVLTLAREALIGCLYDSDDEIRLAVHNFWTNENRLSRSTSKRIVELFGKTYVPSSERHFLSYATSLIMEMTSWSPDYKEKIFGFLLSDCKFYDYKLSSSWKQRHESFMTPLFANAQSSLSNHSSQSLYDNYTISDDQTSNAVQATQHALEFSATIQPDLGVANKPAIYNWLTQEVDSLADNTYTIGSLSESLNSTLKAFKSSSTRSSAGSSRPRTDLEKMLRRRFLSDDQKTKLHFAKRALLQNKRQEEQAKVRVAKKEAQVTIYRSYRIGDLPDIEIPYSAIINPLQALAQKDGQISKILVSSLFKGILNRLDAGAESDRKLFVENIAKNMRHILESSTQFDTDFIACVIEICLQDLSACKLNTEDITFIANSSQQHNLLILYVEDLITAVDKQSKVANKRRKLAHNVDDNETRQLWIKLAELYGLIGNQDVPKEIFAHKINSGDSQPIIQAINAEVDRDYAKALKIYENLFRDQTSDRGEAEVDMLHESLLKCCDSLGRWDKLEKYSQSRIDGSGSLDSFWTNSYAQDHYMPYMMRAKMKKLLEDREDQSLLSFIDESMQVPERRSFLEDKYGEELALLYIVQEDYDRAKFYASSCFNNFMQEWGTIGSLSPSKSRMKLQSLQKLTELYNFLKFIEDSDNIASINKISSLFEEWALGKPGGNTTVQIWNDITANRLLFIEKLELRSDPKLVNNEGRSLGDIFKSSKMQFEMDYVRSMIGQKNVVVALKHLEKTKGLLRKIHEPSLKLDWSHLYCTARQIMAENQANVGAKFEIIASSWHFLEHAVSAEDLASIPGQQCEHFRLKSRSAELIASTIPENQLDPVKLQKLKALLGTEFEDGLLNEMLVKYSFDCLKYGLSSVQSNKFATAESRASANLNLATFCKKTLENGNPATENEPEVSKVLVDALLSAMSYGSVKAQLQFPCLLQIIKRDSDAANTFLAKSQKVPTWMFLMWINQITAILDQPHAYAVQPIVKELVDLYPQAMVYPFKLSFSGSKFNNSSAADQTNEDFCQKINAQLGKLELVERFIAELHSISPISTFLNEWSLDMNNLLREKASKSTIKERYLKMCCQIFGTDVFEESVQKSLNPEKYKIFKPLYAMFKNSFGINGEKITKSNFSSQFSKALSSARSLQLKAGGYKLSAFSTWLSSFQYIRFNNAIEIPGQYGGKSKPLPEYHVKIAGFGPDVKIMESIAKPKTIVIRGNDEHEYQYLVKAGEDLRQDNRIEQLFVLMNDIFVQGGLNTKIYTYQVIPLTCNLGIIEWVNNTLPLKMFIEKVIHKQTKCNILDNSHEKYQKWLYKPMQQPNIQKYYATIYNETDRENAVSNFLSVSQMISENVLREAFVNMSRSPEAFVALRHHFITTHAVLCISNWLVGIGDRHLSNFLISMKTGGMIGIDFGHAFGSATEDQVIPELIPFRLTRQFLGLMAPLKEVGLIRATMIRALSLLRDNSSLLLDIMDVFINEPKLDWLKAARQKNSDKLCGEGDHLWYAKVKLDRVKRKLSGVNPCYVTLDEMKANQNISKFGYSLAKVEAVCLGDPEHNIRAQLGADNLTVEQQVACLIDQATDPHILAKSFYGLRAWV